MAKAVRLFHVMDILPFSMPNWWFL